MTPNLSVTQYRAVAQQVLSGAITLKRICAQHGMRPPVMRGRLRALGLWRSLRPPAGHLTPRQQQVLEAVRKGMPHMQIAAELGISLSGVASTLCTARQRIGETVPRGPVVRPYLVRVLTLLAEGMSDAEVEAHLGLRPRAVASYLVRVRRVIERCPEHGLSAEMVKVARRRK